MLLVVKISKRLDCTPKAGMRCHIVYALTRVPNFPAITQAFDIFRPISGGHLN
jgi:hypothetical protein